MLLIGFKMASPKITTEVENAILQWNETDVENSDFGARVFLFRRKEFGHIHQNGDLDIVFGKQMTAELLQHKFVKQHLYVPSVGITYSVSSEDKLSFAVSLLRFSYLIHSINANKNDTVSQVIFENEMAKLPESLSSIYFKPK